nr:dihydrofolate reductase family protein [uncultured Sellimonas sp.]
MRKIILYIAMSIDGYIADASGKVDWLCGDGSDPEALGSYPEFYKNIDTIILGWKTYHQIVTELFLDKWVYKGKQSYVITHHPEEEKRDIHFYNGDVRKLAYELKQQDGKDIWICGGADIAQQLIKEDVIDQYHLSIIPTILGNGVPLFQELEKEKKLRLIRTVNYNGIVDLVYERR